MTTREAAPEAVILPETVGIGDVATLAALLQSSLASGALALDGRGVEQIDTAGLQLLLSTARTAADRGVAFRWAGSSTALRASAARLGVAAHLRLEG
jgi:anti-anti-sigma regulatory factor